MPPWTKYERPCRIWGEQPDYLYLQSPGNDEKIQDDEELQNWAKLLSTQVDEGGAGIKVSKLNQMIQWLDSIYCTYYGISTKRHKIKIMNIIAKIINLIFEFQK